MKRTRNDAYFLDRNISELPYFRGLLRAVEARAYKDISLEGPVLDLGCGDGHFASVAFDHPLEVGLDPWAGPIGLAQKSGSYKTVIHGSGSDLPFPDDYFHAAVSNSVLEHIPDLVPVLKEMARVLKPGAIFVFCVPNENFLPNLSIARFFDNIHLGGIASAYRVFFNFISRHHHSDDRLTWENRLREAGLTIEKQWNYFSKESLATLEWGHYFGLPSLVTHFLFKTWILVPTKWNLALTRAIVMPRYQEEVPQKDGAYSFYIVRRLSTNHDEQ